MFISVMAISYKKGERKVKIFEFLYHQERYKIHSYTHIVL